MIEQRLGDWRDCRRCGLSKDRRKVVLGRGTAPADYVFIGEAPGRSEDLIGQAFIGRAGKLLDQAIAAAVELARRQDNPPTYYITNVVGCVPLEIQTILVPRKPVKHRRKGVVLTIKRPPEKVRKVKGLRQPTREEELACWPRLGTTIRLVDPVRVVLLGKISEAACLDRFPDALCLRHPAYILRRGGTGSTEFRTFVRELSDLFKREEQYRLGPRDVFGHTINREGR